MKAFKEVAEVENLLTKLGITPVAEHLAKLVAAGKVTLKAVAALSVETLKSEVGFPAPYAKVLAAWGLKHRAVVAEEEKIEALLAELEIEPVGEHLSKLKKAGKQTVAAVLQTRYVGTIPSTALALVCAQHAARSTQHRCPHGWAQR